MIFKIVQPPLFFNVLDDESKTQHIVLLLSIDPHCKILILPYDPGAKKNIQPILLQIA